MNQVQDDFQQAELEIPQIQHPVIAENSHYSTLNEDLQAIELQNQGLKLIPEGNSSSDSYLSDSMVEFDQMLQDIGFGKYQVYSFIAISLFGLTEGSQLTVFTVTVPILQNEWGISSELTSMQASFVFIGFLIGSVLSGLFTDRYGRKLPFFISSFLTTITCMLSAFSMNIYQLLTLRGVLGVVVGFFAPCSISMLQEITPKQYRGKMMSVITISVAIGQLYGLVIAEFVLNSLKFGNWRLLTFFCSLPAAIAWFISLLVIDESAKFELLNGKQTESFHIIDRMINVNKSKLIFDNNMKIKLVNWAHYINNKSKNINKASIQSLFLGDKCKLTFLLWCSWFVLCFLYYGNLLLQPYILQKRNDENELKAADPINQLLISCGSDLFGSVTAIFMIERKGFGRKNSLILVFAFASLLSLITFIDQIHFIIWSTLEKYFLAMGFIFLYQSSVEIYPTKLRATGLGLSIAVGRLGVIIMPWICMYLANIQLISPFLLFSSLGIIGCICCWFLPTDQERQIES